MFALIFFFRDNSVYNLIFCHKLLNPSLPCKDFKFWTKPFASNCSSLKALSKYPFVSITWNLWKYLNIFVSISILSSVFQNFDKTLILLVNLLAPNICLHIDISIAQFYFQKSGITPAYRMTGFTKESTSLRCVPIGFPFELLNKFCVENHVFLPFLIRFSSQHIFLWWYKCKTQIGILACNFNLFSPIIKLKFFCSIPLLIKYDNICFLQIKI